ncbi:protease inhibitor I42 family protein, partial [Candidatus Bipolaricaulota bacterium]|nr:protease inhibitor I42 family protein [Candidatus Bipolaricaulota bacterium]
GGRGFPAEFRLIYGFPGSGMMGGVLETQMVTLPNVSSPDDQLGYTCRGVVTIPRSTFPAAYTIVFKVERISYDDNHIAFNKGSLVILAPTAEAEALTLKVASPSDFASTGDVILGTVWCRRPAHTLEWTWGPLSEGGSILEAAVNLNLLVTNTFDGGSGFSASVPVAVFDLSGKVVESGLVELVNTFKPRFTGDSGGIGYAASGAYELKYPEIISHGFKLRLAWPAIAPQGAENEPTGTTRYFGGNENSALLAYVVGRPAEEETGGPVQATVSDILASPQAYEGTTVRLEVRFFGWAGGLIDYGPPLTRSDWIVGADGWYIYVTGPTPEGLSPWDTEDYWKPLLLEGTVRTKLEPPARVCPYLEVQSVEALEEAGTRVLDEDDNGRTITMDVGNTLIVRLWGNPTTGYLWECTQTLIEGVLQLLNVEFQSAAAPSGMVGVSGVFIFRFQILASGTVPLQLVYHRPWEEEAIETFSVTIVTQAQKR